MKRLFAFLGFCTVLLPAGCGKTDLCGLRHGVPCNVTLDWCNCVQERPPERLHLLVYPADGTAPAYHPLSSEGGTPPLTEGRYDLLLFNAEEATGVAFRNMESYRTAEVYLPPLQEKAGDGEYAVGKPGIVYLAGREGMQVPGGAVTLTPKVAVRLLRLEVRVGGRDDITACEGRLTGVSVALNLATGEPSREHIGTLCFTARPEEGVFRDELVVFGVNPAEPGKPAVPNMLSLTLTDAQGERKTAEIDLTGPMDGFTDPTAEIAVEVTPLPLGMRVEVAGWKTGTDGWGVLDRPSSPYKNEILPII